MTSVEHSREGIGGQTHLTGRRRCSIIYRNNLIPYIAIAVQCCILSLGYKDEVFDMIHAYLSGDKDNKLKYPT